jgi:hypothetical protein
MGGIGTRPVVDFVENDIVEVAAGPDGMPSVDWDLPVTLCRVFSIKMDQVLVVPVGRGVVASLWTIRDIRRVRPVSR